MNDKEMSVYEHLGELRKRLIIVLVFFWCGDDRKFLFCRTGHLIFAKSG